MPCKNTKERVFFILYKYNGNDPSVDARQDPGTMHPHSAGRSKEPDERSRAPNGRSKAPDGRLRRLRESIF